MVEVQVRSEETGTRHFDSLEDALKEAAKDKTIWKISFFLGNEPVRLRKENQIWVLRQMKDEMDADVL